ncbi:MAG: efflux RND transporter periplasmic adaptor subunit [Verrucomicrobiae bacterium]|nr:efflux RND transporter periplasmic adaptor subunit [Verrucomicrobiae bacterium]
MRFRLSLILAAVVTFAFGAVLTGCGDPSGGHEQSGAAGKQKYHCPMHPTYVSDRPGDCPICNMKLVPIKGDKPAAASTTTADSKTAHINPGQFYCPMHLNVVSNAPGTCPECNMKLVEKKAPPTGHEGHSESAAGTTVPGRISISLSPDKRQLIGLTMSKVEKRNLTRTLRTAALVEHDERRYAKIAPRFAGWVRKLHVNFTGAPVEKGEPLFTVYSPELFSTESEYLIAWRGSQQSMNSANSQQRDSAEALLESARLRLALFEIGEEEIRELEKRGRPSSELLFRAPLSGHVLVKNAIDGKAFMAGESLFEIADLSHVWLRAYVYESELPLIELGQEATINFPYLNDESFPASVTFIYPHIEPQSRRGEVRLEIDNPHHRLRPDMWANVDLEIKVGERLTAPASALIDTGKRYVAFVDGPEERLEPREVKIGTKTDDFYEVVSGLREGERVVTRALFLVDSESQLKAAIAGMGAAGGHQH